MIDYITKPSIDIYKYQGELKFIFEDSEIYELFNENIVSIVIDSDYDVNNMPIIFITLSIPEKYKSKIVKEQDSAIIILDIRKTRNESDMDGFYTDYISDRFMYLISEDVDKNDSLPDDDVDNEYETITIGLLSIDHMNKNKRDINCVVNGKLSSVMYYVTSHLPIVIEPPTNNIELKNRFIPPMNSISKVLSYLNSVNVFYKTKYRFFIDFDCSYLISSSGKAVPKQDELASTVMINLKNGVEEGVKEGGMWIDYSGGMYIVDIDGADCELINNHTSAKSYSKITGTNTNGLMNKSNLEYINSMGSINYKTRNIRLSNNNDGLLDNVASDLTTGSVQLMIQKPDTDASVFSINKEYIVNGSDVYETNKYNGRYILVRKRELYIKNGNSMRMNVMLLLQRVSD